MKTTRCLAAVFLLLGASSVRAQTASTSTLAQRIEASSARFLGLPYLAGGPLGEGPAGVYDNDPLSRFDGFDCTTFVETVMALSLAKDNAEFETSTSPRSTRPTRTWPRTMAAPCCLPAKPLKPKYKAKVEAGVLIAQRWILAVLRHHVYRALSRRASSTGPRL